MIIAKRPSPGGAQVPFIDNAPEVGRFEVEVFGIGCSEVDGSEVDGSEANCCSALDALTSAAIGARSRAWAEPANRIVASSPLVSALMVVFNRRCRRRHSGHLGWEQLFLLSQSLPLDWMHYSFGFPYWPAG